MELRSVLSQMARLPEGGEIKVLPFGLQAEWTCDSYVTARQLIAKLCEFYSHSGSLQLGRSGGLVAWESPSYRVVINLARGVGRDYRVTLTRLDRH